jgi:hypothetical protein
MSFCPAYAEHQFRYHHLGWTVLAEAVPRSEARRWAATAEAVMEERGADVELATEGSGEEQAFDEGGAYHHDLLDGLTVRAELPELWGFYLALPHAVEAVVCREIIRSPYPRSAVNVKIYRAPGGTQGWHRDTNAVTALLYLTDDGHPTVVENLRGEEEEIPHEAGDLLLMQGRRCRHWVPPMSPDTPNRLSVPLNLYHPDDTWRPEGIDDVVYGSDEPMSREAAALGARDGS